MSAPPDFTRTEEFVRELSLVPEHLREDAIQEAWLAHLEGRSPADALRSIRRRESKQRRRFAQWVPSDDGRGAERSDHVKDAFRRLHDELN